MQIKIPTEIISEGKSEKKKSFSSGRNPKLLLWPSYIQKVMIIIFLKSN